MVRKWRWYMLTYFLAPSTPKLQVSSNYALNPKLLGSSTNFPDSE